MTKKIIVERSVKPLTKNSPKMTPAQIRLAAQSMEKAIEERAKRKANGTMLPEDEHEVITEWL